MKKSINNKKRLNRTRISKKQSSGGPQEEVNCAEKGRPACAVTSGCKWHKDMYNKEYCAVSNCINFDKIPCGLRSYCNWRPETRSYPASCQETCLNINSKYKDCNEGCRKSINKEECWLTCNNILNSCGKVDGCMIKDNTCRRKHIWRKIK